jgi:hypothetical protein
MSFAETFGEKFHEFMEAAVKTPEQKLREGIDQVFEQCHEKWNEINEEVRGLFGTTYLVDEMALYFPDPDLLMVFVGKAVQRGWVLFNQAEDNVTTQPIPGAYAVQYWFLRHPDRQYRLELMAIDEGHSPYHASLRHMCSQLASPVSLAHASFKVPDEKAYAATSIGLRKGGFDLAQHCTSDYGRFSYYINSSEDRFLPTVKPRVNLRDDQPKPPETGFPNGNWLSGGGNYGN